MKTIRAALTAVAAKIAGVLVPSVMNISINVDRALALEIERDLSCPTVRLNG
jgi:hypothetical protein